ncbi:hypothetical protein K402DRAFT_197814 [Aulographum hederae CBS 113979]|uniref:Uncharacterized protein n=1 Tax=Aulographum hederae CBS 113979 TaxID=1176131 RepID=A0A6G1GNH1_9PEZI|nr:hypothetical protein K402DRAFT_197814 [Aulographum hederae CBS 113979]
MRRHSSVLRLLLPRHQGHHSLLPPREMGPTAEKARVCESEFSGKWVKGGKLRGITRKTTSELTSAYTGHEGKGKGKGKGKGGPPEADTLVVRDESEEAHPPKGKGKGNGKGKGKGKMGSPEADTLVTRHEPEEADPPKGKGKGKGSKGMFHSRLLASVRNNNFGHGIEEEHEERKMPWTKRNIC